MVFSFICWIYRHPQGQKRQTPTLHHLVRHSRTPRTYLEKVIGLIMWITQLFPFMHIWVRHLYNDLYSIPCTNYSMDPGFWPQLPNCLTDQLQFKRQPASSAIPIGSTLVSVRHQDVASKDDLQNIRISHLRDPGSDKRILTKNSLRILTLYQHWLEHSSPLVPLRPRPLWCGLAAADAFANSDVCGIGGFIRTASQKCFCRVLWKVCQTRFHCSSDSNWGWFTRVYLGIGAPGTDCYRFYVGSHISRPQSSN